MKPNPIPLALFVALATTALLSAQDKPTGDSTTARILGEIPDGTPPPPEPPKPEFIIPAKDILKTTTHQQGGRTITVRKINPIALPEPPKAVALPDTSQPAIQESIAEITAKYPDQELLFIGATVFHAKDSTIRSLVQISPMGGGESVSFWSSADFALLSGFASFIGSEGYAHSLIMSWGAEEIDSIAGFIEKQGTEYGIEKAPELPAGKAAFAIISEKPTEATLASIQSLHDLYNNEYDRLKTAYQGRERARLQHEAELIANPPKPKDIVLNYWRTERPAAQVAPKKGAAR
jgi:hypothetical protein